MICNYCGAQLPEGSAFCNFCGAQLTTSQTYGTQYPTQNPVTQPNPYQPPAPEKNNKKSIIIAAIAALVLVIVVVGIAVLLVQDKDDKGNTTTADSTAPVSSSTSETTKASTPSDEETSTTTTGSSSGTNDRISRGVINNNSYTNAFAGISFTKPSSWHFYSDSELESTFGIMLDGYSEFEQNFIKNSTIYDMMATSPSGSNLMVMFEDLSASGNQNITMDSYIDALLLQFENQEMLTYYINEEYETNLGGVTYTVLDAEADSDGITIKQRYYLRKKGKYMIGIIMSASTDSEIDKMEDMFSAAI